MSLVGNLEDLGLGDILQIVSLSRKSGVLSLRSRHREGRIVFLHGQVIRASGNGFRENLGDLLLRKGLVDLATLKKALAQQQILDPPPLLGSILADKFAVPKEAIDALVKEQIEKIVYSFFGWTEGTFSFALGESVEVASTSFSPMQFMLDQGLNPQWLAMEGSRILDEKRHRGEPLEGTEGEELEPAQTLSSSAEACSETDAPGGAVTPGYPAAPSLLLADDDLYTREKLGQILQSRGFNVRVFGSGGDLLSALRAGLAEAAPVLVIDLIMPRMDGSGILGGVELLERVRQEFPALSVMMMTDYPNQEAEEKVRKLGIAAVLEKPKKSELREEQGLPGLQRLVESIVLQFAPGADRATAPDKLFNLGAEILHELGETGDGGPGKGPQSPGLHLLKGMLQELNKPSLGGGIILLILRFASELMNRAVVFLVKEREIVGLGQFGIEVAGKTADARVRQMIVPRQEETIFRQVIEGKVPMKIPLGNSEWDLYLTRQLGGGMPQEVFLGPIISEEKVVALLYGDNLPHDQPIGDTEALEIFLSQAGLAMEKALLERRLRARATV